MGTHCSLLQLFLSRSEYYIYMYTHTYFSRSGTTFLSLHNLCHCPRTSIPASLLLCIQHHHVIHSLAEAVLDTTGYKIAQKTLSVEAGKIA